MSYNFSDDTLVVCPNEVKEQILNDYYQQKKVVNVKFETIDSYKKKYYFDYGYEAIKYLCDKHEMSISNSKEIIENLYYVDIDKTYNNKKLDDLVNYKKELEEEKLLFTDPFFKKMVETKNVVVCGYGQLDSFNQKIFSNKQIEVQNIVNQLYDYYSFVSMEEEVEFLYNQIYDLLEKGVDINNIYITNVNKEYYPYFSKFNKMYPFEIEIKRNESLSSVAISKEFIDRIEQKTSKEELYDWLTKQNSKNAGALLNIINKYYSCEDLSSVLDYIKQDLTDKKAVSETKVDVVKEVSVYRDFADDEHVFLLCFNDNTPVLHKDNEYITDNIADLVGLDKTEEKNRIAKDNYLRAISHIPNLIISHCDSSPFTVYNPSFLIDDSQLNKKDYEFSYEYSEENNRYRYNCYLDEFRKYNIKNKDIDMLYSNYQENDYLTYDNSFTNDLNKVIAKPNLSYTSLNTFYLCQFRYYLDKVLKINDDEEKFSTKIGTLCHEVLKDYCSNPKDYNFDSSWNKNVVNVATNTEENFFLDKLKEELKEDIEIIKDQKSKSALNNVVCEKEVNIDVTKDIKFNGKIDKIMYDTIKGKTNACIIDYKTGSLEKIRPAIFQYGLSLQLPAYLYLLMKGKIKEIDQSNLQVVGYYLQHLINSDLKYNNKKSKEDIKKDSMKLVGYTSDDMARINYLDIDFAQGSPSEVVKSLKLTSKGFDRYSKIASDDDIEKNVNLVDEKIKEAGEKIIQSDFRINPKIINDKNESCKYCPYSSICYLREKDKIRIETDEKEETEDE